MDDMNFKMLDENGKEVICTILHNFIMNNLNYIIYTDGDVNETGNLNVFSARYILDNNQITLKEITSDEEWDMVEKEWSKIYEEV